MNMFTDENGNFVMGRHAKTRGDVEKEILKYCERKKLPFDIAFKEMWDDKLFTSALGAPYDLSINDNLDFELHRAFLVATRYDVHSTDLQRKFKQLLKVESGKELDTKKSDVEFYSGDQICLAVDTSLHRVYQYYKHDMSEADRLKYLEQKSEVMLKVHMDAQRYQTNLELLKSRMRAFTTAIMDPAKGRTVLISVDGEQRREYDKDLDVIYKQLVRNYLTHNAYVVTTVKMVYLPAKACILFNLGMNCPHSKNCTIESKWHVFFTHWCFPCGPQDLNNYDEDKVHPLVACKKFRATWMPCILDSQWQTRSYTRPDMPKMIKARQDKLAQKGGRRGGKGGYRGRGNGRGYGRGSGTSSVSGAPATHGSAPYGGTGDNGSKWPHEHGGRGQQKSGRGRGKKVDPKQEKTQD